MALRGHLPALAVVLATLVCGPARAQPPRRYRVTVEREVASWSGEGVLDRHLLIQRVRSRAGAIARCADRAAASGEVVLDESDVLVVIAETGRVVEVMATSSAEGSALSTCIERIIFGFRFVPGPTGGRVAYSVILHLVPVRAPGATGAAPR